MLASELIAELQKLIDEYGDLEVAREDSEDIDFCEINTVYGCEFYFEVRT